MTLKSLSRRNQPHRILYVAIIIAVVLIGAASVFALYQNGFSLNRAFQVLVRLNGSDLIVKVDHTALAADGKSQSQIEVVPINTSQEIVGRLTRGPGLLVRESNTDKALFTYTSGDEAGEAWLSFRAGLLEKTVRISLREATAPNAPVLISPADKSQINQAQPEITGTGPADTKIIISTNGNYNTTVRTDQQGGFRVALDKPLYNGSHTISAVAISELGMSSSPSNLITVTVKTEPASIDQANLRIVPKRIVAGSSYAVFVPASIGTQQVFLDIAGGHYELFDYHKSSVFSAPIPAPAQPGLYIGDVILVDAGGNQTKIEKIIQVSVSS